jgi:DEAD/DEAH box helicase domain-containing protein
MNNPIQIYNELRDTYLKYISSGIPFFNEQYDAERKELLKENGTICQPPIIEIVPKYKEQASLEQFCKNENVSNELNLSNPVCFIITILRNVYYISINIMP